MPEPHRRTGCLVGPLTTTIRTARQTKRPELLRKAVVEAKPNAQTLMIYLLCGPHTSVLPGLFVSGQAALAEALEWPVAEFRRCFAELADAGIAKADWSARVVWLPKAARHNPPDNPNVVKSWQKALDIIPECELKREAACALEAFLQPFGKPFAKQEQYQYQYQGQDQQQESHNASPLSRRESRSLCGEGFEAFWEAYPNKKAKREAEKAWMNLKPDADLRHRIQSAIATQRRSESWEKEDGKYVPHPATWLRGRRWEHVSANKPRVCLNRHHPPCIDDVACSRKYLDYLKSGNGEQLKGNPKRANESEWP